MSQRGHEADRGLERAETILSRLEIFGVRLGLERSHELLANLGSPHVGLPVVLVAGSNGKGSTAALLASIVGAAGYRVGLYTSPHLEKVEERIRVNGVAIEAERLAELLDSVVRAGESPELSPPTYFEALTLAAFLELRQRDVDLAVLEVGLGGRLDATNVAEPVLSLVTSIALDHQAVLGETLTEIAGEKAGIFRTGVPAFSWVESEEALSALRRRAEERGTPLEDVSALVTSRAAECGGGTVEISTPHHGYRARSPLPGDHQVRNLALATRAAEKLAQLGWDRIDAAAIERGIGACRWPGRLESVVLDESREVLLDAAHNREAAVLLGSHLERRAAPYNLVFGALRDKAAPAMLETLAAGAGEIFVTAPASPRAQDPGELVRSLARDRCRSVSSPAEALSLALAAESPLTLVCGSIYLVGEVRRELTRRFGRPTPAVDIRTGL